MARLIYITTTIGVIFVAGQTLATERTINGWISMGSDMGLVWSDTSEFPYALGVTRGIQILSKGCPIHMGEEIQCIVKFREENGSIIEFISAKRPGFDGKTINLLGQVFDTELCPSAQMPVATSNTCKHVEDLVVYVERANPQTTMVMYNQDTLFVPTQRVLLYCKGIDISLKSFMTSDFPPGVQSCRLKQCPSDTKLVWTDCQGTRTVNGDKYVGEFRDNVYDGQGTLFAPDGSVKEVGLWRSSQFIQTTAKTPIEGEDKVPALSPSVVPLKQEGGTFVVPVLINDVIKLNFTIDSGAADVSLPADVVSTLIRAGSLKSSDFTGEQVYKLADGSTVPSATFVIRSLKVGERVLENVKGSVASINGSLLLGQSFLSRFDSWSIDNKRQVLLLN
jgi:clan AA aspartic protease (TIGR02281 family)